MPLIGYPHLLFISCDYQSIALYNTAQPYTPKMCGGSRHYPAVARGCLAPSHMSMRLKPLDQRHETAKKYMRHMNEFQSMLCAVQPGRKAYSE